MLAKCCSAAFILALSWMLCLWHINDGWAQSHTMEPNSANTKSQKANHLADSFSPYLRQHKYNPVEWYEWGDEALGRARRENKPILVSVGYSTCYWCHVLEREVFMQEDAAAIMNEHFINIKVDREVRPDLDKIYMVATQSLTGSGGWPNNVFLTPDLKPFYAATYLPKDRWKAVTQKIALLWGTERDQLEEQSQVLADKVSSALSVMPSLQASLPVHDFAKRAYLTKKSSYDNRNGGFGAGIKFPEETDLLFLLDFAQMDGDAKALDMVQNTVDHMLSGGIHDHVGGGFHRYSTDPQWHIPHFEKMLYNQARMAVVLARLYEHTQKPTYKRALIRLLDYVERDMTDAQSGAFFSAQDAETDAIEGAYYVWADQGLKSALGADDYGFLMDYYHTANIPHIPGHKSPEGAVLYLVKDIPDAEAQKKIDGVLGELLSLRQKREVPLRDEKIMTAWNGMMIMALAEAARVLKDDRYAARGEKAAQFILSNMRQKDGRLYRIFMDGKAHQRAFFEDYAWLTRGLMALHHVTGNDTYRNETINIIQAADRDFADQGAGGYYMADGRENLFVRIKAGDNAGALPSDNAVMAHVLGDLYRATGDQKWKDKLDGLISAFAQGIIGGPHIYSHIIHAMMSLEGKEPQGVSSPEKQEVKPSSMQSKDQVDISARIVPESSTAKEKTVKVVIKVEEGWHINANPASLADLIPTVVDIQTEQKSTQDVTYPKAKDMKTPLGQVRVYDGTVEIISIVRADEAIVESTMRALIQVQACKDDTCYAPSQISVDVKK